MREILFRGKLKYTNLPHQKGDWVYGDYVKLKDGDRIMHNIYGYGEVDPETIGQYTGLTDKNGKRIFEGDIVKTYDEIYVITWDNQKAMFYLRNARVSADFYHYFSTDLDIIGNIHDNLELIGGNGNE